MVTPHEYYLLVINKAFDEDGIFSAQCVDGFKHFCRTVVGYNISKRSICSPTGYATSIWDNFDTLGLGKYFDKVPANNLVDGDWVIWSKCGTCPSSHIAMFRKDNGNGTGIFLGQNQGGKNGAYNQVNISYSGLRGGMRPKCYHQPKPTPIKHNIGYKAHVQSVGWQSWKYDGETSGTTGQAKRLEAIRIDYDKPIYAKAHIQSKGWVDYGKIDINTVIGTVGEAKRLEAICLKGNIKYRVHIEGTGWTQWTKADGIATLGSVGMGKRIEAIQIEAL